MENWKKKCLRKFLDGWDVVFRLIKGEEWLKLGYGVTKKHYLKQANQECWGSSGSNGDHGSNISASPETIRS